jgi:hypothetical protein
MATTPVTLTLAVDEAASDILAALPTATEIGVFVGPGALARVRVEKVAGLEKHTKAAAKPHETPSPLHAPAAKPRGLTGLGGGDSE